MCTLRDCWPLPGPLQSPETSLWWTHNPVGFSGLDWLCCGCAVWLTRLFTISGPQPLHLKNEGRKWTKDPVAKLYRRTDFLNPLLIHSFIHSFSYSANIWALFLALGYRCKQNRSDPSPHGADILLGRQTVTKEEMINNFISGRKRGWWARDRLSIRKGAQPDQAWVDQVGTHLGCKI